MALLLRVAALLCAMIALGGCTYAEREPGLFATRDPSAPASSPQRPELPPRPTNPALPVVGERIWTTSDGNDVTVRLAVHAVRRTDGLTVLDWSVTPLSAPGASVGDNAPRSIDLGLTGASDNTVGIVLLDGAGHAYRPVTHRSRRLFNPCLCTPMWLVQQGLRIGETALLQAAYPALPETVTAVDVAFATVAPIFAVPVTPAGAAPAPAAPTNLARPADRPPSQSNPVEVLDGKERVAWVTVDSVVTRGDVTAVTWTIEQSQNWGRPFGTTPPLVGAGHESEAFLVNASPADGLGLRAGKVRLRPTWMTARIAAGPAYECLCTEIGLWARTVGKVGGRVQVMTLYPGLPEGTKRVQITVPGVAGPLAVPVQREVIGARLAVAKPVRADRWTLREGQPARPWSTFDWPTPLPYEAQPDQFDHTVETLGPLPD